MTVWTQPSLLDLLNPEPTPSPAPVKHTPGRIDPYRRNTMSFCWRCHKWISNEFPGTYQYVGRDALTKYLPSEREELHELECPFVNGGHAAVTVEETALGNAFITCLCGGKYGQNAFEQHLSAAPSTGAFLFGDQNA